MTMMEVVRQLQAQGHEVDFYVRKDGGILVKNIDGEKFTTGASGNARARQIAFGADSVEIEIKKKQVYLIIVADENGYIKYMIVGVSGSKFSFLSSREYVEIPWDCVTKVGANVIVISADETKIKRARA